ncbi:membrane protein [Corynebacterium atypicum]|uniref:Membrane protein n=1 Tax=Corynebacterium atypicum TaxID=191610 RepID=A0ABM5QN52_9CORY|nr:DUF368 domain-containing protein [Corynebacterium atypicum]AIG64222.1 membrane protein [Corynebacterium atypicum]
MPQTLKFLINVLRGAFIGLVELVPGISGGTVALIIGIYERALHNGTLLIDAVKQRTKAAFRAVDWPFLAAVGLGMVAALFTMSGVMHGFVEAHPQVSRGLFLGMVAVSIVVPVGMMDSREVRRRWPRLLPIFAVFAIAAFFGTGFTAAPHENPSLILIFFAAMIAVCALILPGLSGSFMLLAFGLYQPVTAALSARDWPVIFTFILGAAIGVIAFVRVLDHLLSHHRTITLTVMAGLMAGSLRALWPWQGDNAELMAPAGNVSGVVLAIVAGAALVAGLLIADHVLENRGSKVISTSDPKEDA